MSEKDQYRYRENCVFGIKANQTVIIKKRYLKYLRAIQKQDLPSASSASIDPEDVGRFPAVNSYYPFTEDVDAFARVHHFVEANRFNDPIDKQGSKVVNEYGATKALQQFLHSKPTCFLILGKPGLGEEEIGKRLADYWKCVYIDPLTLLQDEIALDNRPGQCIEFNLRCGRAIGVDVLLRLLANRIQRRDVLHRGFVCSGFPLVSNGLYEEDPISSESAVFTVREIFEEIVDQTLLTTDLSGRVAVSIADSNKDESLDKLSEVGASDTHSLSGCNILMQWSSHDAICGPAEIGNNLDKQMNFLFGLFCDPFVIVYVHCRDSDVVTKRSNYYFDSYANSRIDMQKVRLFYEEGSANEALVEDLFQAGPNPFAENPTLRHLVRVPEHFPANVNTQLDRYHSEIVNSLDCRILQHDQQYYIKVDGRSYLSQMMYIIKLRLQLLPLQQVILPHGFVNIYEDAGENAQLLDNEEMSLDEQFNKFSKQNTCSPMHPWRWSNWSTFCPVSMFHGVYQNGSPKYVVRFSDKLFFLANEQYYHSFIENPRSYLLPPFPKPGSNGFVFGPPLSGKSVVAKCLGYVLNSKVLTPGEMHTEYFNEVVGEYKEKLKQSAIAEAMEILKHNHRTKLEERKNEIAMWEEESRQCLVQLTASFEDRLKTALSSFPMKMEADADEITTEINKYRQRLIDLNFPANLDEDSVQNMLENPHSLLQYLPDHLTGVISEPSVLDPFVLEYANKKVEEIDLEEIRTRTKENMYEIYTRSIRAAENLSEHYGWLIDDMTTDTSLIQQVHQDFPIYETFVLTTSDNEFLVEKFRQGNREQFREFRNFFLKMGERDAAWRAPSMLSFKGEEIAARIVADIVDSVLEYDPPESDTESSVRQYRASLEAYHQEVGETIDFLKKIEISPIIIDVNNLTTEGLLEEVLFRVEDKYRLHASEFTEDDRAAEMQRFLSLATPTGGESEGGTVITDEFIAKNRRYGDAHYYCPVSFRNKFVLWRGKEQFAVKFKDKVYLCANETNMKRFLKFPRKYLLQLSPPHRYPPPRICVLGPDPATTRTVAEQLANNIGVHYINFENVYKEAVEILSTTSLLVDSKSMELPEALLLGFYDKWLSRNWFEEPRKYSGFVIDGFPDKPTALDYMIAHEAIPDTILHVAMSREENLQRQLNRSLTEWRRTNEEQRKEMEAINLIVRQQWEDFRKARYNELIEMKRQQRYYQKIRENVLAPTQNEGEFPINIESGTQISIDSIEEQQEHDEVMRILDEEFPEPSIDELDETEEMMVEQWTTEIEENYDQFVERCEEIKTVCDSELIPFVEINGGKELDKVIRDAFIIGNDLKFRGPSIFERCYDLSLETAEKLLNSGFNFLSSYGRLCPVQYYDGHRSLHGYLAGLQNGNIYPVVHRKYIYFLNGKKSRARFFKNPLKYTRQENVNFPLIPLRVAVIGPPKSGKTALAQRFERDLAFRTLTRGQAIRYVVSNRLYSNLNSMVKTILRKGEVLSDELTMDCVYAASLAGECISQGLFFDGFPNTITEMKHLSRLGLVPHLIFDLQITEDQLSKQIATPDGNNPQYSQRFLAHRVQTWSENQKEFRLWCDREYQNIFKLPVDRSIWGVFQQAQEVTLSVHYERKHYYKHVQLNWPLRLANMIVTPLEFLERRSSYKSYCPGCLYYSRKLTDGGEIPDRTGLIHYERYFYWFCEEHIEDFLKDPEKFLPPSNVLLPQELPQRASLTEKDGEPVEGGYCLSCYINNIPHKVLNKGRADLAVKFRSRFYVFDSVQCLKSFMQSPETLSRYVINFKEEDDSTNLQYRNLPVLGMLEQYLGETLVRAVNHANVYRPVIPGLSVSQAAAIFIGLNLKTHNSKTLHQNMYQEGLQKFHERRENLLKYLEVMKKYLNPFVFYEEPDTPSSTEEEVDDDDGVVKTYASVS